MSCSLASSSHCAIQRVVLPTQPHDPRRPPPHSVRCGPATPSDDYPGPSSSASAAATSAGPTVRLAVPSSFSRCPSAELPLPELQQTELQLCHARSHRRARPAPPGHAPRPLLHQQPLGLPTPLNFLVSSGYSLFVQPPGYGCDEDENEDQDARALSGAGSEPPELEPAQSQQGQGHESEFQKAPHAASPRDSGADCIPLSAERTAAQEEASLRIQAALKGAASPEGQGEGQTEGPGWSADSAVRGLMGLWGGLRGHAKAAQKEQQEQESREEQPESQLQVDGETPSPPLAAVIEASDLEGQDSGEDATSPMDEVVGPSPVAPPPAKANAWAVWALSMWRREKQQQQVQEQQSPAPAEAGGTQPAEVIKAVRGTTSCSQCGACQAYAAASSTTRGEGGTGVGAAVVAPHNAESMSRFLHPASLGELRSAAVISRLCHLAYTISDLNEDYLFAQHRMRVVTTSMRKEEVLALQQAGNTVHAALTSSQLSQPGASLALSPAAALVQAEEDKQSMPSANAPATQAYSSTASALASAAGAYAQTGTPPKVDAAGKGGSEPSVKEKERTAEDKGTCPCHWFVCDEQQSGTRHIIIQGSESLASWQANLTFDPVPFEDPRLGVLVHRGIYSAAKALFRELLPLIRTHLAVQGQGRARIQLAGHSLGGSLASLLGLMLHLRGEVSPHNMLPMYTFGAPSVMCGGDQLLARLGLPPDHIRQVVMHRDLVPRAFACEYPGHIAQVLRRVSGALRNHPCLLSQRLVYAPMGHMMVLQPEEQAAPFHPLLPPEAGLFHLQHPAILDSVPRDSGREAHEDLSMEPLRLRAKAELRAAQLALLNNPHPLEILADPSSYGAEGNISRDHDPRHYTFALAARARKAVREGRREDRRQRRVQHWMPLLQPPPSVAPSPEALPAQAMIPIAPKALPRVVPSGRGDPYAVSASDEDSSDEVLSLVGSGGEGRIDSPELEILPAYAPGSAASPLPWRGARTLAAGAVQGGSSLTLAASAGGGPSGVPGLEGGGNGAAAPGQRGWWLFPWGSR